MQGVSSRAKLLFSRFACNIFKYMFSRLFTAKNTKITKIGLLFFVPLVLLVAQPTGQLTDRRSQIPSEARSQIRRSATAVGLILVYDPKDRGDQEPRPKGSAVVVRKDGVVVTNYHVISENRSGQIYEQIFFCLSNESEAPTPIIRRYHLKPVLINRDRDLVLLRIVSDADGKPIPPSQIFPIVELGDSQSVQLLDDLVIIGFPEKGGSSITMSTGVIEGKDLLEAWIKTDARLIHGNSGGAAVTLDGKLIGIPTKVVTDSQPVDKDGDGFPDAVRMYGAVGFLRPVHLVGSMLAHLQEVEEKQQALKKNEHNPALQESPQVVSPLTHVKVYGVIKSALGGKPVAGARVGLVSLGSEYVTAENLLTWGGTNAEGSFELNRPVPPGRYTIKAKAIRYDEFSSDVYIDQNNSQLIIELRPSQ
jgi:S1-C subfamily serine protease